MFDMYTIHKKNIQPITGAGNEQSTYSYHVLLQFCVLELRLLCAMLTSCGLVTPLAPFTNMV